MAIRILAAGFVAASLLVAPAFAQSGMTSGQAMTPAHTETTTTTTDKTTADTDKAGKTVVHHHKKVKHHAKASKTMVAAPAADAGNTM